jgi:hypothetical protein
MKKSYLIIIYIALILNLILFVNAIGIGPPRIRIDFEPGLEKDIEYFIVNTENTDINVEMYVKGELKDYVALDKTSFKLNAAERKTVIAHLALPQTVDKPGTNDIRIGALASSANGKAATVAAKAGVESQLLIEVPYEGKYLSADIIIEDVKVGEIADITIKISNLGKEDISTISAVIDIYDSENNKIDTVSTDKKELKAGETKELKAQWDTKDVKPGTYTAIALIDYDGNKKEARTTFNVGDVLIEIISLAANDFSPGEIAKFTIEVESKWNELIKDVFAEIEIYDENQNLIGSAESNKLNIHAWSKEQIDIFWDSTGIASGKYKVKSVLYYQDKTSEKSFDIEVKKKGNIWIIVLVAAVILLAVYLMWYKWRKSKKKK